MEAIVKKMSEQVETDQTSLEEEIERNDDPNLLKRQKETTMNFKQDNNKIKNDITLAKNRIAELDTTRDMLVQNIKDILKDKRRIDKHAMELEDKITSKNETEFQKKQKQKNEERKQRIKVAKNVDTLKHQGVNLVDKTGDEETKAKDLLEEKLKIEEEMIMLVEEFDNQKAKMD